MTPPKPEAQHQWLKQLVGEWSFEVEAGGGSDKPAEKSKGTESVRSLGELWIVGEGRGEMPGGGIGTSIISLGFNPQTKRFVGTWFGSMMTHLWIYDGTLDATRKILTLETEGPGFTDQTKTSKYRDVIEFKSTDHRVLTASVLGDDGKWTSFMTSHYRRTPA